MKKALHFLLCNLVLPCTLFLSVPTCAQRFWTPQDSIRYIKDSIQARVDSRPDSTRHGFFHAEHFNSTFHIQAEGDFGNVMSQRSAETGFQAAWVINHKISLAFKYDMLTSTAKVNKYVNSLDTLENRQANPISSTNMSAIVSVGYILRSSRKVSFEPAIGIGWTHVSFTDPKTGWIDSTEATKVENFSTGYFVVNPTISVIWNTSRNFRIGALLGAKGVFGRDYLRLKSYRVGGVYAGVFMRFGTF
jgi:hypothetical protein